MRLTLTRTGGFAGILPPPYSLDTAALPPAAAKRLNTLVEAADFFNLPANLAAGAPQPDRFQYTVALTSDDGRKHTVVCPEQAASAAFRELVAAIKSEAVALQQGSKATKGKNK